LPRPGRQGEPAGAAHAVAWRDGLGRETDRQPGVALRAGAGVELLPEDGALSVPGRDSRGGDRSRPALLGVGRGRLAGPWLLRQREDASQAGAPAAGCEVRRGPGLRDRYAWRGVLRSTGGCGWDVRVVCPHTGRVLDDDDPLLAPASTRPSRPYAPATADATDAAFCHQLTEQTIRGILTRW